MTTPKRSRTASLQMHSGICFSAKINVCSKSWKMCLAFNSRSRILNSRSCKSRSFEIFRDLSRSVESLFLIISLLLQSRGGSKRRHKKTQNISKADPPNADQNVCTWTKKSNRELLPAQPNSTITVQRHRNDSCCGEQA